MKVSQLCLYFYKHVIFKYFKLKDVDIVFGFTSPESCDVRNTEDPLIWW